MDYPTTIPPLDADEPPATPPDAAAGEEPKLLLPPPPVPATYGPASAWPNDYATLPPYSPPGGGVPPTAPSRGPRQRRWGAVLLALALLLALAVGGLGGDLIAHGTANASVTTITLGSTSGATTSGTTTSAPASVAAVQQDLEQVAKSVEPSVVEVTSSGGNGEAIGSGDILTSGGYIVTNDHVVQGYSSFTVTLSNGTSYPAQLIGQDPQDDLAVIKINANNLHPITLADSSKAQIGEFAIAIGNPLGLRGSETVGVVSALNRSASEAPQGPAGDLTGLIQTSAPINPGNSGGALVNLQGQMIGIPTLSAVDPTTGAAATGIGYAISSNRVAYVTSQLIAHGQLTSTGQGFIGIQAQDVTPAVAAADGLSAQTGVLVAGFVSDTAGQSPAQQAGLQAGDVITAVNGQTVTDNSDLAGDLATLTPGSHVTLTVVRGSSTLTFHLTLGERPTNAG